MKRCLLPFGFLCVLAAGCSGMFDEAAARPGASHDAGEDPACWADQTVRCLCELDEGFRLCGADGKWAGPCVCEPHPVVVDDAQALPTCGNGTLQADEACDDGNAKDGDGCSAACVPDGRPASVAACPGQLVKLWPGKAVKIANMKITTVSAVDAGSCGSLTAVDRVYAVIAGATGTMTIVSAA